MKTALTYISGIGMLILFVVAIAMSLNKNAPGFLKYLLAYTGFIAGIGLLFFLFGDAYVWIGLLAAVGWIVFMVKGSGYRYGEDAETDDDRDFRAYVSREVEK